MRSIRARLLVPLVCGTLVVLLLGGGGVYLLVRTSLLVQLDAALASRAQAIAMLVTFENGRFEMDGDDVDRTDAHSEFMYSVKSEDGSFFQQEPPDQANALEIPKNALQKANSGAASFDLELPGDRDGRGLSIRVSPHTDEEDDQKGAHKPAPTLVVTVAASRDSVDRAMAALVSALGVVGLALVATVVMLLWFGVQSGLAPLDRLVEHLRDTDARSPRQLASSPNVPGELAPVYGELNRLLARLRSAMERERLFTDAASHELRTPLAELQTVVEVAERWPDSDRPIKALHETKMIGEEMQRMVDALLVMRRTRVNGSSGRMAHILVAPIVKRALSQRKAAGSAQGVRVDVELEANATWPASQGAVELIVRNLLDNACAHTPEDGFIHIILATSDCEQAQFIIENSPVDLSPDDIGHLTEFFWRKDASRSDRSHVGLGLSVVDRIATDMGLVIEPTLDVRTRTLRICVRPCSRLNIAEAPLPE